MILVDANIWSIALRRNIEALSNDERRHRTSLEAFILASEVAILHAVRQEVLTSLRSMSQFNSIRERLRDVPDVIVTRDDYERAAAFANRCASRGIATSGVDMLLCAVAIATGDQIWTADRDFERYAEAITGLKLLGI